LIDCGFWISEYGFEKADFGKLSAEFGMPVPPCELRGAECNTMKIDDLVLNRQFKIDSIP
jgi:hypothetical protein